VITRSSETVSAQPAADTITISSPRFLAFLTAHFLGVVNDYAFRITLVLFVLSVISGEWRQVRYSSLATALFQIPFLLFSPIGGYLTDRFPKDRVLRWTKVPEILCMIFAIIAFYLRSLPVLYFVLFLLAMRGAFYSPAKYGILPDIFPDAAISAANGVLEMVSNLGILIGSLLGVYVFSAFFSNLTEAGVVYLAIACAGTLAVLFVPRAPAINPQADFQWNIFRSFRRDYAEASRNPTLYYALVGIAWFGFIASFFITVIPVFGKNELGLDESQVGLLFALLSIGIGIGAVVAGWLSRGRVEIGLVPMGSVGITIFSFFLSQAERTTSLVPGFGLPLGPALDIIMIGFSSGFFLIPLNATLQQRAPAGMKGRLLAFSNVLLYGAILVAAGVPWLLASVLGVSLRHVILFAAVVTLVGTIYVVRRLPDFLLRLMIWLLTNSIYRLRVIGEENQPKRGALLVGNHVSLIDGFLVSGSTSRMVRYLALREYYEYKSINWFFRATHAIPVSGDDSKEKIEAALERAREDIRHGHVVCIFAEGSMTRTGNMLKFRRGLERIAAGVDCPIVPFYLDGVWGSIFSYERGRYVFKIPRHLFQPVTVVYGKPMPSTSKADEVRRAVQDLSAQTFEYHKRFQTPIHLAFIRRAKQRWNATMATAASGASITHGAALTRAIALSQAVWTRADTHGERVGILMPPGIEAMLANLATLIAGHLPVNIDMFDVAHSALAHAQLGTVITTREFAGALDSTETLLPATIKYFEDADAAISPARLNQIKMICRVTRTGSIARLFVRGNGTDVDQVATILFSYRADSPQTPRGVMLTHHNLLSNLESLRQIFRITREDCVLGLIPFSNSMSFATTLLLPALAGMRVAFASELLGKPKLGAFCRANRVTLIAANPSILASIIETVEAPDLSSLRHVAVGGVEIDDDLRAKFVDKFHLEPLQGYGCPECAPLISLNVPDYRKGDFYQRGTQTGTAGHPVPGVSVRVIDPSTSELVANGVEGMLLVSGPNVMKGYVEGPELTSQVMQDGWYITGDRARLDADGFLTIARPQTVRPIV
jgi:acyl-[acyl-carrier-protein]-phospholipid O-acyltransferase/long-chain-fatty-acid--[acyl-carrier-protein] ligase